MWRNDAENNNANHHFLNKTADQGPARKEKNSMKNKTIIMATLVLSVMVIMLSGCKKEVQETVLHGEESSVYVMDDNYRTPDTPITIFIMGVLNCRCEYIDDLLTFICTCEPPMDKICYRIDRNENGYSYLNFFQPTACVGLPMGQNIPVTNLTFDDETKSTVRFCVAN